MSKKVKNFLMNPWTVGVGTGLIVLLVTIVVDWISNEKIFNTLSKAVVAVWKGILISLNFELKIWWILVGLAFIVLSVFILYRITATRQQKQPAPPFLDYTSDSILGYT